MFHPLIYNAVKKNFGKLINSAIGFLIWFFLFVSFNISVERAKKHNPMFGAVGYFKYFGVPKTAEKILSAAPIILIYFLLILKFKYKISNERSRNFICVFLTIKICTVSSFLICYSSAIKVNNYCFCSLVCGVLEYAAVVIFGKLKKVFSKNGYQREE